MRYLVRLAKLAIKPGAFGFITIGIAYFFLPEGLPRDLAVNGMLISIMAAFLGSLAIRLGL